MLQKLKYAWKIVNHVNHVQFLKTKLCHKTNVFECGVSVQWVAVVQQYKSHN